ncbi:uncharacterized protein EI97DRAFT_501730 [Westerdykella ornata]|uniref:BZIP domain-containing protein n=1 Tax=Westerdykella ornata TaxID=318751 RepID=A0A6A6JHG9_WESOR|nr:uncharacterized protein EI97DRAFT_501730 [Westerdykella ornata]KAF2276001.1 hypothetical protein EI97DRAFT_501730 [Westerdykella ornata]
MVTRRASDAAPPPTTIAPIVKRKRRASCLGEQERRERKRAIDREAQRSLREKTKTHIAELERTIQILRDQDRNGATASLLSEIDALRTENERLRDVIDSVKSVVGCEIFGRSHASASGSPTDSSSNAAIASAARLDGTSPAASGKVVNDPMPVHFDSMTFAHHIPTTSAAVDLDGMTISSLPPHPSHELGLPMDLDPVFEMPEERHGPVLEPSEHSINPGNNHNNNDDNDDETCPDSPTTAAFAPFIHEIFGPSWRCPSPVVLHFDNADRPSTASPSSSSSSSSPSTANNTATTLASIWRKMGNNDLSGKTFSYLPDSRPQDLMKRDRAVPGPVPILSTPKGGEVGCGVQKLHAIKAQPIPASKHIALGIDFSPWHILALTSSPTSTSSQSERLFSPHYTTLSALRVAPLTMNRRRLLASFDEEGWGVYGKSVV